MRLAAFNVENLFSRAKALNEETRTENRPVLEAFSRFTALINQPAYSDDDKDRMVALLDTLGLARSDQGLLVRLRQNRGEFLVRRRGGGLDIVANGRGDWTGFLELEREPVDNTSMRLTAQVIRDVGADVLGVVEAENRPSLKEFSETILPLVRGDPYRHVMLIDGNDIRGIDCAVMARPGFRIDTMRSHVDDEDAAGQIFSRDCPEFHIETPGGNRLVVLVNHFKSKGFGAQADSNRKRRRQAEAVAGIYRGLHDSGIEHVAVVGDLNDTPPKQASDPLHPLLAGTDLQDVSTLPGHADGGFPGTFGGSTASNKIDYILLSPALVAAAGDSGIFRKGMWPGVRPRKWDTYPEIDPTQDGDKVHAASDHGAVWVDLDI